VRWPLNRGTGRGRLPSLGQDFTEGHRRYVERMGAGGERWLRTKPFSAPPIHELRECLRVFAHIVERLGLGFRAQVLDVGCGPGWLSEFLARCGYWVTGVDVSEDMVRIARERIAAISEPVGEGVEALAEFHAMPVREMPWTERFDAAILYDAMHHFDDELATLRVIRRTLVPGGRIFIHEGVRPEEGSEGERQLIAEMEAFGTLESPFEPDYLVAVLRKAGFDDVRRFAAVDELLDVSERDRELERVAVRLDEPPMNTVIAVNPVPARLAGAEAEYLAELDASAPRRKTPDGKALVVPLGVRNAGRGYWPAATGPTYPLGTVTVGPYVRSGDTREKLELPRVPLPRSLSPGESVGVEVVVPLESVEGEEVEIDLVREGLAWFAEYGSSPLLIRLNDA
jgi:SAM-dependent methyltransferase